MTALALAAVAALLAGTGGALQQRAASEEEPHGAMDPRLVFRLLRRRRWLLGMGLSTSGFAFQATAIGTGHLSLVEPMLAGHVLVALLVSAHLARRRLGPTEWRGLVATVVGIGGFLAVAAPTAGGHPSPVMPWFVPLAALTVVVVVGRSATGRMDPDRQALTLGVLAGLTFGFADALIKVISDVIDVAGVSGIFDHWALFVWLVVSPCGFLLQQSAFHSGHLGAALPPQASIQPTIAAFLGVAMLGEHVRGGWAIPIEAVFAVLVLVGVTTLARSPLIDLDAESDAAALPS